MKFTKTVSVSLLTYVMKADVCEEVAELIANDIRGEIGKSDKIETVVIDFQSFDLDYKAFKTFTPLAQELRKSQSKIYALSENRKIHALIRTEGMDKVIKPVASQSEIGIAPPPKKTPPKLDVNFINPFVDGTIHVLKVQCKTEAAPQKPLLKSTARLECQTDIAGIIGITSKSFRGSISICFPAAVFLDLMSKMIGEECKEINDELQDGAGELTNMIFGYAKKILNENGHTIEKALPSVARGPDIKINHVGSHDSVILPFLVGGAMFFMEIGIEKN